MFQKYVFLGALYALFHVAVTQLPGTSQCQGAANWVAFGDRCYLVYVNQNIVGWDQFETACRQLAGNVSRADGHLAAIRSPQEQGILMRK
ncbi:hypothetical protein AAVH_38915 [Aphelenchoides avenae]|nr:hypothetical protein AAVH_38915 [Aphelenchus avenae]